MKWIGSLRGMGVQPGWDDRREETDAVERLRDWTVGRPADEPSIARSRETLRAAYLAANRPAARPLPAPIARTTRFAAPRRLVFAGATAALLVVGSVAGVLAESGPGQPFYSLRLDVEAMTLPGHDSPARLDADLARARARLDEAIRAADRQDWGAEAAALNAYANVVSSITADPGANGEAARQPLERQLDTLRQLRSRSQAGAVNAVDASIIRLNACLSGDGSGASPVPGGSNAERTPAADSSNRPSAAAPRSAGPQGSVAPQGSGGPQMSPGPQGTSGPKTTAGADASAGPRLSPGPNGTGAGNGGGGGQQGAGGTTDVTGSRQG
jgi:hypothetical protein